MSLKKKKSSSLKKLKPKKLKLKKKTSVNKKTKKKTSTKKATTKKATTKKASTKKATTKKATTKKASVKKQKKLKQSKSIKKIKLKKTKSSTALLKKKKLQKKEIKKPNPKMPAKSSLSSMEKRRVLEFKKELEEIQKRQEDEIILKDAEGRRYCKDEHCDQPATTDAYCRYHYLSLWKLLQNRKEIFKTQYLDKTIQNLLDSVGEIALLFLIRDLKNEKNFETAIKEMELFLDKDEDSLGASETESHF